MGALSPLTFAEMRATLAAHDEADEELAVQAKPSGPRWRCGGCDAPFYTRATAARCCPPIEIEDDGPSLIKRFDCRCPVCDSGHESPHCAAHCCLWRDLAYPLRHAIASAVENGATWREAIDTITKGAIE